MRHFTLSLLFLACCGTFPVPVFGTGQITTEQRSGDAVTKLSVENALRAEVTIGDGPSLTIRTDKNLLNLIETVVEDGVLHVRVERLSAIEPTELDIQIHLPALESLDASGASDIKLHAKPATSLALDLSGASTLAADGLVLDSLTTHASGASVLHLFGTSAKLALDASGASGIEAKELASLEATVELSGASHATISASERVTGSASGASTLRLASEPATPPAVELSGASTLSRE